jgi:hypothetical protein
MQRAYSVATPRGSGYHGRFEEVRMVSLRVVLLVLAFALLVLAGLDVRTPRGNLQALGLALWVLAIIVG